VSFEDLKPKFKFAYRFGKCVNWSEWIQFETSSDKTEPNWFLYFGNMQNDISRIAPDY